MMMQESEPAFSPDGTKLAFSGGWYVGGPTQIYVRNLVTGAMQQLTSRHRRAPARVVARRFAHRLHGHPGESELDAGVQPTGSGDLYVINVDGTGERDVSGPITFGESATYPYAYQ